MFIVHCFLSILLLYPAITLANPAVLEHDLRVEIDDSTRSFHVKDRIRADPSGTGGGAGIPDFSLDPGMRITSLAFDGQSAGDRGRRGNTVIEVPPDTSQVDITYGGDIDASRWPYLIWLPSDRWYPEAQDYLIRFKLTLDMPPGWNGLTQGVPGPASTGSTLSWSQDDPQQGIYLVAGPWHAYSKQNGEHRAGVMMIDKDNELSVVYLDAALGYMERYSRVIGTYPYHSFTLVENRRQTGWGMPGFTLLGSQVIRLPFIVHTSFPHEILHNWWGNGVFTERAKGNWSEGLTTYLSDYLAQERRGKGRQYRLNALIAWHDYAAQGSDFALARFRGRHDRATQAVGYGKGMFLFHMLRREIGDVKFMKGLRDFYSTFRHRYASYADLRQAFELACGCGLDRFFTQWLNREGAPMLRLDSATTGFAGGRSSLTATISQTGAKAWQLQVPVRAIDTHGNAITKHVRLEDKSASVDFELDFPAARIEVDPEIDLFRMLNEDEKPTTFSKLFSADYVSIPTAGGASSNAVNELARQNAGWRVLPDTDDVPASTGAAVLLGWDHPLARNWFGSRPSKGYQVVDGGIEINGILHSVEDKKVIAIVDTLTIDGESITVLWLATRGKTGLSDLMRRLPRYGRFSYAVFGAPAERALATGQWKTAEKSLSETFVAGIPVKFAPQPPVLF
jgi:hypothetical protein